MVSGRIFFFAVSAGLLAFVSTAGATSMNDRTIHGTAQDKRVARCGIHISDGKMLKLVPFIEFAEAFDGIVTVKVTTISSSGSNTTHQSNSFKAGKLPVSQIWLDRRSRLSMSMDVKDDQGRPVCSLNETIDLSDSATDI